MILLRKIAPRAVITQRADKQLYKPHLGLIILMTLVFGIPTFSWAMQLNAALNQPNHLADLENYSATGEMF
ncbi:hypothetical protein SAMD00079811_48630 [Scytonema sp. HK-05]|uniref:hypothetical protein n=1 Tax=Scytonema sp. HK-05 TaxID=1137095 RepID=UPI0009368646|nr:hypothetical protein [Scytonema sp. HK-05]OKH57358.1 hypothetical protein NIES2130_20525 [Scytonema sp. HK-05]BAY47246.1 hypothetical protein SAMD00079811_48630 [Scytonema sp. HK-05]